MIKTNMPRKKAHRAYDKSRSYTPTGVGSILSGSFASLGIAHKIKEYSIKKIWAECVGAGIAAKTAPTSLIGDVIHCAVSSSPWMTEMNYHKAEIMEKINARLGSGTVTGIVFKIGPIKTLRVKEPLRATKRELTPQARQFIEETTEGVKDKDLKTLIARAMAKSLD